MQPLRILVVDDEHLICETIAEVLAWDGHEVTSAATGAEALAQVVSAPPDLLVIDLMMPVLDGSGAITKLRADERTAALPIVLMTAAPKSATAGLGYDALLLKPFDVKALRAAVTKALAARRAAESR